MEAALAADSPCRDGPQRNFYAMRMPLRVRPKDLDRLNAQLDRLMTIVFEISGRDEIPDDRLTSDLRNRLRESLDQYSGAQLGVGCHLLSSNISGSSRYAPSRKHTAPSDVHRALFQMAASPVRNA